MRLRSATVTRIEDELHRLEANTPTYGRHCAVEDFVQVLGQILSSGADEETTNLPLTEVNKSVILEAA